MSEKQFEPCSLKESTHIEMDGKLYELGKEYTSEHQVLKYNDFNIEVCRGTTGWQLIHHGSFPILGIKPMRERKREPREFEEEFTKYGDKWHPRYCLNQGWSYERNEKAKFKCVEILED